MKRILTGLQPSGILHIGNYFGAIKPILDLQKEEDNELFLFIANYHALTTIKDPVLLKKYTFEMFKDLLALGINPNKTTFFVQSSVPEVLELNLLLSNIASLGLLERSHAYKDKINNGIKVNHGLFSYPILMASDILLYDADIVPVGKDQIQHIEIAKDLATSFNQTYGKGILKTPSFLVNENVSVIPGIDGRKMSKSYSNTISIFNNKEILKQIKKITTDSTPIEEIKDFNNCIIYQLASLFLNEIELNELEKLYLTPGYGYGHFKQYLNDIILKYFKEASILRDNISDEEVNTYILNGGLKAREIASEKIKILKTKVGI